MHDIRKFIHDSAGTVGWQRDKRRNLANAIYVELLKRRSRRLDAEIIK